MEVDMSKEKALDIIKGALMIEHRGKALYESAVKKTDNDAARELFQMMVDEEQTHIEILNKQFTLVSKGQDFDASGMENVEDPTVEAILTDKVVKEISAAGYESAVIGAALELEKSAVQFYSERKAAAASKEEQILFNWLVKWETDHMEMLAKLDKDIKEQVWYDNSFWPS
jgi:rubrerythrin